MPCPTPLPLPPQADGLHTLEVAATDDAGNTDATPYVRTFTVDTKAPEVTLQSGPVSPVHSGPLAFDLRADEGTLACALDDGEYGSARRHPGGHARGRRHVFLARAQDAAGNISPARVRVHGVNAAPTATLALDGPTGIAPLAVRPTITGADPDHDRLTYKLDFGDGQIATGTLPVSLVAHRYDTQGVYTLKLTVDDGRATATDTGQVTVTTPQPTSRPRRPRSRRRSRSR